MRAALLLLCACGAEPMMMAPDASMMETDAGVMPPPRRVLFVVQSSYSMSAADPELRRKLLPNEAFDAVEGDARFAMLVFSDGWRESGYLEDPKNDGQIMFLMRLLDDLDNLAVLDGALRRAKEIVLEAQAQETDPAIEWSVVILTDGFPTPTCTTVQDLNGVCETPRSEWAMFGVEVDDPSVYYGYEGEGAAYNTRSLVLTQVEELAQHAKVHAILLYSQSLVGQPAEMSFGLDRAVCSAFVQQIASAGGGNAQIMDGATIDWNAFLD